MRIHFIAIGGSIMHNLAISLSKKGYLISGSDDLIYEPSKSRLLKYNLLPEALGWFPEKINDQIDAIILGMHSKEDNPELIRAKELGIQIYSYPEFVYMQSLEKTRVVIGGTFGKTTITSMIMHVLKKLGRDFDYVIGAPLEDFEQTVRLTKEAPLIILEGDEKMASVEDKRPKMLIYKANIGLISGITWDYKDVYATFEDYMHQFKLFVESIAEKGTLIYNKEDKNVLKLVLANDSKINKHGFQLPEYTINKGKTYINSTIGDIPLQVFGRYSLLNIAGAYTVCEWLGVNRSDFFESIQSFKGASRGVEYVCSNEASVVYQDFAQSSSAILSNVQALKTQYPDKDLVSVIEFHPNSYSLDEAFFQDYKDIFDQVEHPVVFINEEHVKQRNNFIVTKEWLVKTFQNNEIEYLKSVSELENYLKHIESANKNLIFLNSGNFIGINVVDLSELFIS